MQSIEYAYNSFCEERFPLPTEKQVSDLEQRIGVTLPNDYREFLLEFNGGVFSEPDILPPSDDCPSDCLTFMHGIGSTLEDVAELASNLDLALFDDNDPVQILPIGSTMMGNLILLGTHPDDRGCIYLKKAFSDSSFLLAEGIEEFFELLREPSDE